MKIFNLSTSKPVCKISTRIDEVARAAEQGSYDIKYRLELEIYMKRADTLQMNLLKACVLIFDKTMQQDNPELDWTASRLWKQDEQQPSRADWNLGFVTQVATP